MVEKISSDKLCELTGLTDRRHRQLAKEGWFPNPLKGEYQKEKTVAGLFKYFREQLSKKDNKARKAEERLKNAKADIAEDERDRGRQLYVLKSEIGPALRNVSLHQRAVLQRKFENELAPNLSSLKTPEILERVKKAVDEVCEIFRAGTRAW